MENLPADIKLDIISRLPAESVLQCRQVCKTWCSLSHHPDFARMHLLHQSQNLDDHSNGIHSNDAAAKLGFLSLIASIGESYTKYQLCYHEYDESDESSYKKPCTRIYHPFVEPFRPVVGSCNGLIYFSLRPDNDCVYICNPITREYVVLPQFKNSNVPKGRIVWGFGYLPSTNEYKVVGINMHCDKYRDSGWYTDNEVCAQVYTLGSSSGWRNIKYSQLPMWQLLAPWAVLVNGVLYWIGSGGNALFFDLATEELSYLQSPPYEEDDCYSYLQVWGGGLFFVHRILHDIDIWAFKKNKKSGTTTENMKGQEDLSWSWSREFRIVTKLEANDYEPFALTKSGEVLMTYCRRYNQKIFSLYDPKTATIRKLDADFLFPITVPRPHVNSFVSLKALGEDAKIIDPAEELAWYTLRMVVVEEKEETVKEGYGHQDSVVDWKENV